MEGEEDDVSTTVRARYVVCGALSEEGPRSARNVPFNTLLSPACCVARTRVFQYELCCKSYTQPFFK